MIQCTLIFRKIQRVSIMTLILFSLSSSICNLQAQIINDEVTISIFQFIFDDNERLKNITSQDRKYALFLFDELTSCSCDMNFIEEWFRENISPPTTIINAITRIGKGYFKCTPAKYYLSCKDTIKLKWKSAYNMRKISEGDDVFDWPQKK